MDFLLCIVAMIIGLIMTRVEVIVNIIITSKNSKNYHLEVSAVKSVSVDIDILQYA